MNNSIPTSILKLAPARAERTALRRKQNNVWVDISWKEFTSQIRRYAGGLQALGLKRGDRIAIMAPNCPEWAFADLAIMACGGLTVPVYHTEGPAAVAHILTDSGSRFLFIHDEAMAAELLQAEETLPQLEKIILLRGYLDRREVLPLDRFLAPAVNDEMLQQSLDAIRRDDLASIIYTSGTTGPPKGVMLTHGNILSAIEAARDSFDIGEEDSCLSFLPLSHIFERVDGYYYMLQQGAVINYAEGIDSVPANLQEVSPTVVISVPRLFEKMYARVMERILSGPWLKKQLFFGALKAASAHLAAEQAGRTPSAGLTLVTRLARARVFSKLRQPLGGEIRFFVSGGAPLSRRVAEFFHAAGLPIYEGYGLTETAAGITVNNPRGTRLGTVGRVMSGTELQLATDGEILIRGKTVFKGYWQNPEKTAEVLIDGWLHSGDIGEIDQDGYLAVTDRKKDLIITAGGENIAPQIIENRLKSDKFITNAFLFGNRKPFLVALLVPNFDNLESYARRKNINYSDHCELVSNPQVLDLLRRRIERLQEGLPSFQHVKRFTLMSRDFAGDEITPTLKLKRKIVRERYQHLIDEMYRAEDHGIHDSGFCMTEEGDTNPQG
ncbi:long-chain fatty acid--CoA ligase [Geothermobacter hydrogeniphilus]|uniref:Long-chain fatty acid--CoA ligase n=1 Tax=Geothermobacter hydrogeniphilus TaxID=1969733 RepID=A0A2K2H5L4_9BACT|nr:long-chain fatty acid--CoA ligase [Geothermobacter hydrogeniphilus]PNU18612.1 long-chain fatty acid--CoA ligase [Geothermobacter hydrogeniphilus]